MNRDQSEPVEGAAMFEAMTWLEVNKVRLAVGAVAILVVGFGIYIWSYLSEQKEVTASAALLELRPTGPFTNQVPVPAGNYLKFAAEHQNSSAGERALYLGAASLFTEGNYAKAQTEFDNLIRNYPSSPWVAGANYGVAASLEAQGKRDEALTAYQRVYTSYATDSVANQARMATARIFEAQGKFKEALAQYDELTKPTPGAVNMGMTMAMQEAFMNRERIFKKHPDLRPAPPGLTNAAPAILTTNAPAGTNAAAGAK